MAGNPGVAGVAASALIRPAAAAVSATGVDCTPRVGTGSEFACGGGAEPIVRAVTVAVATPTVAARFAVRERL